jgi:hypothetical protein
VLEGGVAGVKCSCPERVVSAESHGVDPVPVTLETATETSLAWEERGRIRRFYAALFL